VITILAWPRSSRCESGACVVKDFACWLVATCDSKDPNGPIPREWTPFVRSFHANDKCTRERKPLVRAAVADRYPIITLGYAKVWGVGKTVFGFGPAADGKRR
jgi:hypothetical protein